MTVPWDPAIVDHGCYVDSQGKQYCNHVHVANLPSSTAHDDGSYRENEPPMGWTAQNPNYYAPQKVQDNEVRIVGA